MSETKALTIMDYANSMLPIAKKMNGTEASTIAHQCRKLEGWCIKVTIQKHEICLSQDKK